MANTELKPNTVLQGERNYETALNLLIAKAQYELLIFDQDLSHGDYASLQRIELIQQFLNTTPLSKLTIIVQTSEFFVNKCPKLFGLLKL